jgi:hypothetical protein
MDCPGGLDLTHPIDRMPPGCFPYLLNARVLQEGRIDGRPGYSQLIAMADNPNSIRRLNDPSGAYAPAGHIYVGGGGANLYAGIESAYGVVDNGYSGHPLSLIPFRPDQSPEAWMYVYDQNKQAKVRPDGVVRAIGVAPPTTAPLIEYGVPASVGVSDGQSISGWSTAGISSTLSEADRTNSSAPVITSILYNSGTTGWCCINPSVSDAYYPWMGDRMEVILSGGPETVLVRDVLPAIDSTAVAAIAYDSGSSGPCSVVLTNTPTGLARNSLIQVDSEVVRVLAVIESPTGVGYSLRCSTTGTHAAGATVTGLISWYTYTTLNHAAGESITSQYVFVSASALGATAINLTTSLDLSKSTSGRPIDPANDYLHISLFIQDPENVTNVMLLLTLDSTPNFSYTNPGNSTIFTITQDQLTANGSSGDAWVEIIIPISSGVRSGTDLTLTLANVTGLSIQLTSTATCSWGFDWWYLFGTYGEVIQPNSPTGVVYQSRFRDSTTGAASIPGPQNRYELFPLREAVIITPAASSQAGVDTVDIYRFGGTVGTTTSSTTSLYVGSVVNNLAAPNSYTDTLPDQAVLETNQPPDLTLLQPWPTLAAPWTGVVTVIGTTVTLVSGTPFNMALLSNSAISINGQEYLTFGQPRSTTSLELTTDAGYQANVPYSLPSPTLAGQPLPFAFGPLEGPFAPVIFALGDPINGGFLYFSNFSNADAAGDQNYIEVSTPSSNLVSGAVWNGLCFAGSRDVLECIRYSYLTTIGASNSTTYQWNKVPTPSGIWSRWACCPCPLGVAYLGRDGIYIATDSGGVNISDEKLYPLFPHEGQPATTVSYGDSIILPVDMTRLDYLRLTYCDEELRFSYADVGGNFNTLIYEIYKKRWFINNYYNALNLHYLVELPESGPNQPEILQLDVAGKAIMMAGGNSDNGQPVNTLVLLPSADGGDERSQKLYVDAMTQTDGTGTMEVAVSYNNAQSFSPILNIIGTGGIQQSLLNLASLANLALYRNVGAKFAWTGGPGGMRLYAWETSGFLQPYLSQFFVTQFISLSFPGWKSHRRMYPSLISNSPVLLTIQTQDGRTFGPYTLPSTSGQYRVLPQMLDPNIKDLAFAYQLDGQGQNFAIFPSDFVIEVKEWEEEQYIKLAVLKT